MWPNLQETADLVTFTKKILLKLKTAFSVQCNFKWKDYTKNDNLKFIIYDLLHICSALRRLLPFVQLKKREKHPWKGVDFSKVVFKLYKWYQIT